MSAHEELLERLRKATGPDREIDLALACIHFGERETTFLTDELGRRDFSIARRYTASVDHALDFVPKGWSMFIDASAPAAGVDCDLFAPGNNRREHRGIADPGADGGELTSQIARSICIAALEARRSLTTPERE